MGLETMDSKKESQVLLQVCVIIIILCVVSLIFKITIAFLSKSNTIITLAVFFSGIFNIVFYFVKDNIRKEKREYFSIFLWNRPTGKFWRNCLCIY